MPEEITFDNRRISKFQGVDLRSGDIIYTIVHHSPTSTYTPSFIEIGRNFCGRMYGQTLRPALLGKLGGVDVKISPKVSEPRDPQNGLSH